MVRIGTAGWSIPSRFAANFPGDGAHLERYARVLGAAEINSSFYRPHRRATYERWATSVPPGFRFSVKLPRAISHDARLVAVEAPLDAFVEQVGGLGDRLAVVLVQLAPSHAYEATVAEAFFEALRDRIGVTVAIASEPRHPSWFTAEAEACFLTHHVARVAADPARVPGADQPGGWPGLQYYRLHGSPRTYYSPYADRIPGLAATLREGSAETWCIFDNTASGAATGDALALRAALA